MKLKKETDQKVFPDVLRLAFRYGAIYGKFCNLYDIQLVIVKEKPVFTPFPEALPYEFEREELTENEIFIKNLVGWKI